MHVTVVVCQYWVENVKCSFHDLSHLSENISRVWFYLFFYCSSILSLVHHQTLCARHLHEKNFFFAWGSVNRQFHFSSKLSKNFITVVSVAYWHERVKIMFAFDENGSFLSGKNVEWAFIKKKTNLGMRLFYNWTEELLVLINRSTNKCSVIDGMLNGRRSRLMISTARSIKLDEKKMNRVNCFDHNHRPDQTNQNHTHLFPY